MSLVVGVGLGLGLAGRVAPSEALPPGEARFREGANHHLGDDSFVARFGRAPTAADPEAARMRVHLEHVRARLAAAPATRPELAARRAELLGYLDDYIAKGTTPINTRLPWRSPVFIDDFDNICAVGYLIERSAGRALPEQIAARHRFALLEDIAAAMPEVRAWIDASGFTLDELASIQPGYAAPMVEQWHLWELGGKIGPADGAYQSAIGGLGITTRGAFRKRQMHGAWTRTNRAGRVIGEGTLSRGAGAWRSFYPDGKQLAAGRYAASLPHGAWTFYHPSGRIAAEGWFERGLRAGAWRFYYDTKQPRLIASGSFRRGSIRGRWEHFDLQGRRVAVSTDATPRQWQQASDGGHLLQVAPDRRGVHHAMHRGVVAGDGWRLDAFFLGAERIYVQLEGQHRVLDAEGRELSKASGAWLATDCGWSAKRKAIARAGDLATLHGLLYADREARERCAGATTPVAAARGQRIDKLLATQYAVRAPAPEFVKQAALRDRWKDAFEDPAAEEEGAEAEDESEAAESTAASAARPEDPESVELDARLAAERADLTKTLAASMSWYIEFPHVDGRFVQVFYTLPGLRPWDEGSPEFAEERE